MCITFPLVVIYSRESNMTESNRLITDDIWGILTVWQEAQGELYIGKVAVAEVILRRTAKKMCSDGSVASTVLWAKQFSGWNSTDPTRIKSAKLCYDTKGVQECMNAWQEAKQGSNYAPGALYYYNPKGRGDEWGIEKPSWATKMIEVTHIGNHTFLKESQ